ncbi:hypothetical protein AAKU61_003505 [Undibacterium sp. GrIS 1.2]
MRSGTHFEIELNVANTAAACEVVRTNNETEVLSFANEHLQLSTELIVACIGEGVDFGNLIICVDAKSSCNLRALEHRGFFVEGVSVELALCALEYWLPAQARTPSLGWQDE